MLNEHGISVWEPCEYSLLDSNSEFFVLLEFDSDQTLFGPSSMNSGYDSNRMQPAGYEKIFHDIQIKILLWEQTCPLGGDGVALNYQLFCIQNFSFLSDLMYKT